MTQEEPSYETFEAVCCLVQAGHNKSGKATPEQTLNRLFQKHLKNRKTDIADNPPCLTTDNTTVKVERWAIADLQKLAPVTNEKAKHTCFPVVIIRYRGRDCLIDGRRRINEWHRAGDAGPHPACVITVKIEQA